MTEPSYYAIIPADVRYNNNLSFLERFLYAEITALSNAQGYCYAGNEYFADLYGKTKETISRAISNLEKEKTILINYEKVGTKVKNRKIYPLTQKRANDILINGKKNTNDIFVNGEHQKVLSAVDKIVKDNNITYKDIFNNITNYYYKPKNKRKSNKIPKHKYGEYKNVLLTDEELEKLKNKFSNYEEWIKKLDEGIELKGYKYKSHYLAIIKWADKDKPKDDTSEKTGIEWILGDD